MILGKVLGSLWASVQDPGFDGRALKLIAPVDAHNQETYGTTIMAVDLVGSRKDDLVLVVYEGSSSRLAMENDTTPCEAIVVAIVDQLDLVEAS